MSNLINLLEESHKDLHQWFLFHQECLLLKHDILAQQAFSAFVDQMTQHLLFENRYLFPYLKTLLEKNGGELRWSFNVYEKEHKKIESLLVSLEKMLNEYYSFLGRQKRLAILDVFAKEKTFIGVMEHHEEREESDLFQFLREDSEHILVKEWLDVSHSLNEKYSLLKKELILILSIDLI